MRCRYPVTEKCVLPKGHHGDHVPARHVELWEAQRQRDAMRELLEQMKDMSADELQDQVHRRFEFKLCRTCHMRFLVNPLGKPRTPPRAGQN